jgi:hypothetical protein
MLDGGSAPAVDLFTGGGGGIATTGGESTSIGKTTVSADANVMSFNNWLMGGGFTTTVAFSEAAELGAANGTSGNGGGTMSPPAAMDQGKFPPVQVPNPPPPPTPDYGDDLETAPNLPENSLQSDKNYKFTVTATLKEFKNNNWVNAQTLAGNSVTQTVEKNFFTGPIPMVTNAQQNFQTF